MLQNQNTQQPPDFQILKTENMQEKLEEAGSQQDLNFFQDDNGALKKNYVAKTKKKTRTPYSPTKVKARNFLSNISYRRIADKDFERKNFIIDIFTYLTMDLKPFLLHATFNEENDREMVVMLWNQYVPPNFYQFVKRLEIFEYLLSQNI